MGFSSSVAIGAPVTTPDLKYPAMPDIIRQKKWYDEFDRPLLNLPNVPVLWDDTNQVGGSTVVMGLGSTLNRSARLATAAGVGDLIELQTNMLFSRANNAHAGIQPDRFIHYRFFFQPKGTLTNADFFWGLKGNETNDLAALPTAAVKHIGLVFDEAVLGANLFWTNGDGTAGLTQTDTGVPLLTTEIYLVEIAHNQNLGIVCRLWKQVAGVPEDPSSAAPLSTFIGDQVIASHNRLTFFCANLANAGARAFEVLSTRIETFAET